MMAFSLYTLTNPTTLCIIISAFSRYFCFVKENTLRNLRKDGNMDKYEVNELPELDRNRLIEILTDELPVLRAKLGISQDDISSIVGISRQTYSAIETKKRKMSWNTFLSLILFYGFNEKTTNLVEAIGAFPPELKQTLSINRRMKENK